MIGDSREGLEDFMGLICDELESVRRSLSKVEMDDTHAPGDLKKKLKFAFKQEGIEKSMDRLRQHTQDFVSLVDLCIPCRFKSGERKLPFAVRKSLRAYSVVKDAALDLHEAFQSACTKHTGHQAHLNLAPTYAESGVTQLRFALAFSQLCLDEKSSTGDATWLTVETAITGELQSTDDPEPSQRVTQALKRAHECLETKTETIDKKPRAKLVKKQVRFGHEPTTKIVLDTGIRPPSTPVLLNLCSGSNFCTQLQRFLRQTQPDTTAIGYLKSPQGSKHLIYVDSKSTIAVRGTKPPELRSLYKVLVDADQGVEGLSFSLPYKIGLGKKLAKALLQFHATPWLGETWSSREVLLGQTASSEDDIGDSMGAYVSAQIQGRPAELTETTSQHMIDSGPALVRNRILFGLGVMLLEIAYLRPFASMIRSVDRRNQIGGLEADFRAADRLSRSVSAQLGAEYAEITRKLIHTDFGRGFSMEESRLQEAFYQDVICELEYLEHRLRG
ncbi:hypothetical protein EDD36DRAFT_442219 [Exophiala viscosa]|uniref:DUF7580 domain-containing protein n=1 Tax=Exophiala viscosa TaxID=2486360 RepID=A0AAN6DR27_9EURO|nr:hypothetical protein EDD36DRAFT_442219 [Exophiala viscosa]